MLEIVPEADTRVYAFAPIPSPIIVAVGEIIILESVLGVVANAVFTVITLVEDE